jgi:hypothetical protein
LPDDVSDRWCMDISCVSGNPLWRGGRVENQLIIINNNNNKNSD